MSPVVTAEESRPVGRPGPASPRDQERAVIELARRLMRLTADVAAAQRDLRALYWLLGLAVDPVTPRRRADRPAAGRTA